MTKLPTKEKIKKAVKGAKKAPALKGFTDLMSFEVMYFYCKHCSKINMLCDKKNVKHLKKYKDEGTK